MPNFLRITVENPDDILNAGLYGAGALIRVQAGTAAVQPGDFADVFGTGSTPTIPVVADTRSYNAYDPAGGVATWYRTRYESADASRASEWSASFQTGDETAGLLCSVEDVEQELGRVLNPNERESVIEKIRQVTTAIEGYTGRWFVPRPLSGEDTYIFSPETDGPEFPIPVGIRSLSAIGYADTDQRDSGGTYTALTVEDVLLVPGTLSRTPGWPATGIRTLDVVGQYIRSGLNRLSLTGAFGWSEVPPDIQGVALRAVIRRWIGKSAGGAQVAVGPNGTEFLLPDMSGADRGTLEFYKDRT